MCCQDAWVPLGHVQDTVYQQTVGLITGTCYPVGRKYPAKKSETHEWSYTPMQTHYTTICSNGGMIGVHSTLLGQFSTHEHI